MIIVQLDGDMGNQMFQYALGRRLSLIHKTELRLDLSKLNPPTYQLDAFASNAAIAETQDVDKLINLHFLRKTNRIPAEDVKEPNLVAIRDNTYLTGTCMNEKYYRAIRPLLRQEFQLKSLPSEINRALLHKMSKQNAVSLYMRMSNFAGDNLLPLSENYYYRAIEYVAARVKKPVFYIFSDDPKRCAQTLVLQPPHVFVQHNTSEQCAEDFRLMSACRHHIIANDGMSWWPAWLNSDKKKIVVAPAKWFDNDTEQEEIFPSGWSKMNII